MSANETRTSVKLLVTVTFLLMIAVNALANIIPINGVTTGQVADAYANLFTPAPYTFAIWGLIYILLLGYVLYQLGLFKNGSTAPAELMNTIGIFFSLSSIANALWIISWHNNRIILSMLLMIVILICLIVINGAISKADLTPRDKLFISVPFGIYFGWITVATIANAVVLLVSLGWNGFGIPDEIWTVIILAVGAMIGLITMLKFKNPAYGLALIWAYAGILYKHISESGFDREYPAIIATAGICIIVLAIAEISLLRAIGQNKRANTARLALKERAFKH